MTRWRQLLLVATAPRSSSFLLKRANQKISLGAHKRRLSQVAINDNDGVEKRKEKQKLRREYRLSMAKPSVEEKLVEAERAAQTKRTSQAQHRMKRAASREHRIGILESATETLTYAEQAELNGLLVHRANFEEQYDPSYFSDAHVEFKASHNRAFSALVQYCDEQSANSKLRNIFFLDGPDGATAASLNSHDPSRFYIANRHQSTCATLSKLLPKATVVHATAAEALMEGGVFGDADLCAYYFDGCGGFVPHVINMITAALLRDQTIPGPVVVGFSIVGGNRDVVDKEVMVLQSLNALARRRGLRMTHVLDDPARYGVEVELRKVCEGTLTTWLMLEAGR